MKRKELQRVVAHKSSLGGTSASASRIGLLAFAFVFLIAYLVYRQTSTRIAPTQQPENNSGELSPKQLSQQELDAKQPFSGRSAIHIDEYTLPATPRTIDTKTEQDQLLSRVEKLVADYPQSPDAMHIAAITYSELLQTDKAATFFVRSLKLDTRSPQVLADYAGLLLQTGKQQSAVDLLISAPLSARTAAVIDSLGNAYMQLGELDKAAEALKAGLESVPGDSAIHLRLAQVQLQLQQFEQAEKNARVAIALGRTTNAAYTALSSALIRLGRREEALEFRGKAVQANPQAEVADELYKRSFQQFAAHTNALIGGVYRANGQVAATEAAMLESLSLDPTSIPALVALGDLLYQQQRAQQAVQVYQRLVDIQPENLFNFNNLASLALSVGNIPLAENTLRRAAKADPTGNATIRLADFLLRLGNSAEATRQAETAVKQLGNAEAYLVWISALKADGKMAAAMSALIRAREIIPGDDRLKNIQL